MTKFAARSRPAPGPPRPRSRFPAALAALVALLVAATAPSLAQIPGSSYTLSPTYDLLRWDDELGLEDTELYGGRLGLNLGHYIAVTGFYRGRNDVPTRLRATGLPGVMDALHDQEFDLSEYGGEVTLRLGSGNIVPFLRGGGGILALDGDDGQRLRQIAVRAGGGFQFGIDRWNAEVYAGDDAFRLDRSRLGTPVEGVEPPIDEDARKIRHNLALGAAVNFTFGGDPRIETAYEATDRGVEHRLRRGLRGLSIPVEPFVGRLEFHDDLALEDQELFGLRAGADLGPYVGLRGFYWRGASDDLDRTEPIEGWGGEAQFNLNAGGGAVPYLLGGVAQIDFKDEYRDRDGERPADRTALVLGGGVSLRLSERLRLNASVRDYITSDADREEIARADQLHSNWLFGASLGFNLFGDADHRGARPMEPAPRTEAAPVAPLPPVDVAAAAPADSRDPVPPAEVATPAAPGRIERPEPVVVDTALVAPSPAPRNYAGERVISIPVPIEGELYVRYGPAGAVRIESRTGGAPAPGAAATPPHGAPVGAARSLESASSDAARDAGAPAAGVNEAEVRGILREELARRDAEATDAATSPVVARLDRIERRLEALTAEPEAAVRSSSAGTWTDESSDPYHWEARDLVVYTGANLDEPEQGLIGGRLNLGPVSRNSSFDFVPEVALGFGSDVTSVLVAGNLQWSMRDVRDAGTWSPFLFVGAGFLHFGEDQPGRNAGLDITLNAGYGLQARFGNLTGFAAHQGVDLFDLNRLLAGVRVDF
jgi:hypothetical protein